MILQAKHTHLYPGHSGRISGIAVLAEIESDQECLVAFVDGSATSATLSSTTHGWQLTTAPYRTDAGTSIPEKCWAIILQQADDHVGFRVASKERTKKCLSLHRD